MQVVIDGAYRIPGRRIAHLEKLLDGKFHILELAAMKEEVFFFSASVVIELLCR